MRFKECICGINKRQKKNQTDRQTDRQTERERERERERIKGITEDAHIEVKYELDIYLIYKKIPC